MTLGLGILFAALVAVILFATGLVGGARAPASSSDAPGQTRQSTGTPIAPGRAKVAMRGWNKAEAEGILDDFAKLYKFDRADLRLSSNSDGTLIVDLPNGLPDDRFLYLVNYLNYPNNYDLTKHRLVICGIWQLDDPAAATPASAGSRAVVYMPQGDSEYDLAYIQVDRKDAFKVSFTNMAWTPVSDALMPPDVAGLERSID